MPKLPIYPLGRYTDIGLEILVAGPIASPYNATPYQVRYLCCGAQDTITHKALRQREIRGAKMCLACRREHWRRTLGSPDKMKFMPVTIPEPLAFVHWPVPAMVLRKNP